MENINSPIDLFIGDFLRIIKVRPTECWQVWVPAGTSQIWDEMGAWVTIPGVDDNTSIRQIEEAAYKIILEKVTEFRETSKDW